MPSFQAGNCSFLPVRTSHWFTRFSLPANSVEPSGENATSDAMPSWSFRSWTLPPSAMSRRMTWRSRNPVIVLVEASVFPSGLKARDHTPV